MVGAAATQESPLPHILFVDDEAGVRAALRRQLKRNFQVTVAATAQEGLQRLSQWGSDIDVIASDFAMPGFDGLSFLRRAASRAPLVSQVLVSGALGTEVVVRALNEGPVFQVLTKPWRADHLSAVLRRAAARTALLRDNSARLARLEAEKEGIQRYTEVLVKEREASLTHLLTVLREAVAGWPGAHRAASTRIVAYSSALLATEPMSHLPAPAVIRAASLWGMVWRAPLRSRLASLLAGIPELSVETSLLTRVTDSPAGDLTLDLLGPPIGVTADLGPRTSSDVSTAAKVLSLATGLEAATNDVGFQPSRDWSVARQEALRRAGCEESDPLAQALEEVSDELLSAAWLAAGPPKGRRGGER